MFSLNSIVFILSFKISLITSIAGFNFSTSYFLNSENHSATMEFTYDKETLTLIEYKESVNQKLLENNTYKENFINVINAYKEDTETINNDKEKYKGITATLDYDEENYSYTWTREYNIKQLSEENFDNLSIVLFVDKETFK